MKLYKNIFNVMVNIRVQNATIANFATVIILHSIAKKTAMQIALMKVSLLVHNGSPTNYV